MHGETRTRTSGGRGRDGSGSGSGSAARGRSQTATIRTRGERCEQSRRRPSSRLLPQSHKITRSAPPPPPPRRGSHAPPRTRRAEGAACRARLARGRPLARSLAALTTSQPSRCCGRRSAAAPVARPRPRSSPRHAQYDASDALTPLSPASASALSAPCDAARRSATRGDTRRRRALCGIVFVVVDGSRGGACRRVGARARARSIRLAPK